MHGKSDSTAGGGRTATKEQLRVTHATHDGQDDDRSRIQKLIKEIVETTRCSLAQAEIALLDASNNVEVAVNNILESSNLESWSHPKRKGLKGKDEEREEPVKKGGSRPPRRGNQRDFPSKGGRTTENGNENRQPRNKEDGEFRGGNRNQQPRNRREPGAKREGKKPHSNATENKEDGDDHWKNGPLVFNRRENIEDKEQLANEAVIKPVAKQTNAGPLSFADVVRRNAQKPQAPPPQATDAQYKLQVDAKQAPPSPHSLSNVDGLQEDNIGFNSALPETSKSPRQLGHHLNVEPEDEISFGVQPSSQKMHQSLTEQLKTDLGLGAASNSTAFGTSPPKKFTEPFASNKASTVKAGVVEFLSGDMPAASSGEWQFGFEAAPIAPQNTVADEHQQYRRDNVPKVGEPTRNEIGLPSSNINESNVTRNNASAVLNQYVPQQQSSQYGSHQQSFNRNRNGTNNLPFANNYSDNFNSDLRSSYGAPASPPKTQPIQQPLQNLASQQLPSQQTHHHQQLPFPPYPNYPYMYSPVAPGLREDFGPILPFQYQSGLDALMMIPQLTSATSAGPLPPTNHQAQHHQNQQQQNVQQGLQHNQSSHSQTQQSHQRNDYSDMKFLTNQMSIPPASQQNNGNGHNTQQNSNLGNNQQRQQLLDNNSGSVPPPPGFPSFMQRNHLFQQPFQVPAFTQFPYVMPGNAHKSK